MASFGTVTHDYVDLDDFKTFNDDFFDKSQEYIAYALRVKDELVAAINIDGGAQNKVEINDRDSKKPVEMNGLELKRPVQITDGTRITHIFAYKDGRLGVVKNGKKSFAADTEEVNILFKDGIVCDGDSSCSILEYVRQYQDYMKSHGSC